MDELKDKAEALYHRDMGTSFGRGGNESLQRQSVRENGMPFVVTANRDSTYGRLSKCGC